MVIIRKTGECILLREKITKKILNSEIIPESINEKIIIVPVDRDWRYYKYIKIVKKALNYKELFDLSYDFYDETKLSLEEIDDMDNDYWSYIKDAKSKIKKGNTVCIISIMGNLCRFEGVEEVYEDVYRLKMGS